MKASGLARIISKAGYCSRSRAAALITAGRVQVNGRLVRDPEFHVDIVKSEILVDAEPVRAARKIYLMMNKPRGIVTTASDEKGRDTIYSLLNPQTPWVAPVGRLDKASEGLLLLTNDSHWGARIASPEFHIPKTYHVQITAVADQATLDQLQNGVKAEEDFLRAKSAVAVRAGKKSSWIEIVLEEGKNRQIRRMFSALGVEVTRLVRIAVGELELGDLPKGSVRELTREEKIKLGPKTTTERHTSRGQSLGKTRRSR